jgi:ribonuclease HII
MKRPNFSMEAACGGMVAGIDEAGCSPLAGPVVAAAVILEKKKWPPGINDSKQVPAEKREELFEVIVKKFVYGVGIATVEEIDTINIYRARFLAMTRAFEQLSVKPEWALIDGNRGPALPCQVKMVVKGDTKCLSIAAASIVAKVTRDRIMRELAREFPVYGWDRNVGYGTPTHKQALHAHGITIHHRKSFGLVKALLAGPDLFGNVA